MKFQKKIYLSRAQTRAMAMDHPIGDPTGGPAYGEKNDPVSAVVAVATMVGSAGGAAALIGGAVSIGTVAAGLAFAGGAMSLVGNVTGNKNLQQIGTIASIAGGVGGLMDSAGFMGEIAKDGATTTAGETVAKQAAQESAQTGAQAGAGAQAAQAPSVSESIVGNANPNVVVNAAPAEAIAAPTPLSATDTSSLVNAAPQSAVAPVTADAGGMGSAANLGATPQATDTGLISSNMNTDAARVVYDDGSTALMNPNGGYVPGSVAAAPDSAFGAGGAGGTPYSTWDKLKNAAGSVMPDMSKLSATDKLLAMKVGSDIVGGAVGYVAPSPQQQAQTEYAKAAANNANAAAEANRIQAEKQAADLALQKQRIENLNRNMSMGVSLGNVNGGAVQITRPTLRTGLIANQMQPA